VNIIYYRSAHRIEFSTKEFKMGEQTGDPKPKSISKEPFAKAVDDAQILVHYAVSKCKRDIDDKTLTTLITAKRYIDENKSIDAKTEAEFWLAYQHIWKLVAPATAGSIKATRSNIAPKTVNWYILFTILVLIAVLVLQIYWVIGNQLTAQLAELLKRETELSQEITTNRDEYNAIEMRFKQNEWDSESFKTNGLYIFYSSPDWERDTLDNLSTKVKLETDLASLKSQLEGNSAVLLIWGNPWKSLIEKSVESTKLAAIDQYASQTASINRQLKELNAQLLEDPDGSKKIREVRKQMDNLQKQLIELERNQETNSDQILSLRSKLDNLTNWINQPGLTDLVVSQLNQDIERLNEDKTTLERQQQGDVNRETSRQAQLATQFVLAILQSYLLPLLYGILGAGTFVLRSLSKEIEDETFSDEKGTKHLLRVSLGALAGILVGWFSFLIPNETTTFVGSISPFAIAFLVGYNIELFFALMDRALFSITDRLQRPSPTKDEQSVSIPQASAPQPTPP
jgi:chemotaxis protein histidine kinase CheA